MKTRLVLLGCLSLGIFWTALPHRRSESAEPPTGPDLNPLIAPPKLSEKQTRKLTERLQRSLEREKTISPATLQYLWQIKGANPDSAETDAVLRQAIAHADPRVVMLAADAISRNRPAGAQQQLAELQDREEFNKFFGFRRSVTDAVSAWQNAESVDFLIKNLATAKGQYRFVVVSQLMKLTGQNFADDHQQWAQWWASARESYRGPPASSKNFVLDQSALAHRWNPRIPVPEFFDVPLFAKKIVFVIDRSRSMLSVLGRETRLQVAQTELTNAIAGLADDVSFNIITFDDNVIPWKSELVPANRVAKADAVQFVASIYAGRKTASYDALSKGLTFSPYIELIVFLSDGKPTVGQIVDPAAIIAQITKENTFLRATIDTIGIDTFDVSERFMYHLARNNYGTYKKIR